MTDSRAAKRYAKALFNAAVKQDIVSSVDADLAMITHVLNNSANSKEFFRSPKTTQEQKMALLERTFSDRVTALTMHLLRLVTRKRRDDQIFQISLEFTELRRQSENVVKAVIESAVELTDAEKDKVAAKVAQVTGRRVEPEFSVDERLMGGVKVTYDNFVLDGTVRGQLNKIREHLLYDVLKQA